MAFRLGVSPFTASLLFLLVRAGIALAAASLPLQTQLRQIFVEHRFQGQHPPEVEWFGEGAAYTNVEKSKEVAEAQEIVRYETASGKRDVLVPAGPLIPKGEKKPLSIDGYQFSKHKQRVLIFTNTKPI